MNYQQSGTDQFGNPIYSATQSIAPELQGAFGNLAQNVTQTTGQQFNPTLPSVGINPGEEYSAAILRRLQPIQERQSKQLDTQLANQGIMPGSEAYDIAKQQLAQNQNDQYTSAVIGGMQTGLQANQQAYNQALTNYNLPLNTLSALRTGSQVQNPSFVNSAQQATTSGADILGATQMGYNAQMGNFNAQQAAQDPVVQMQMKELQLKAQEVEIKMKKMKN
mgnify:CR=1 FL=1